MCISIVSLFVNISLITQFITVNQKCIMVDLSCIIMNKVGKLLLVSFKVWGYLPGWEYLHNWHLSWHWGIWRCCWLLCTVNYCLYLLKFEDIFQDGNIFITGICHYSGEFEDVADIYVQWCIFLSEVLQIPTLQARVRAQIMLWIFMNA